MGEKCNQWAREVTNLAQLAVQYPHEAYTLFSKSTQHKWGYSLRVGELTDEDLEQVEEAISQQLIPALMGQRTTETDRDLFSLPPRSGGLGLTVPTRNTNLPYDTSKSASTHLTAALTNKVPFDREEHEKWASKARNEMRREKERDSSARLERIIATAEKKKGRAIQRSCDFKTSSWLTATPTTTDDHVLSATEFRDSMAIRYRLPLLDTPAFCDGCEAPFDREYGLDCAHGGNRIRRHNEIRDALGKILIQTFGGPVEREPVIKEGSSEEDKGEQLDLLVRCGQQVSLIDCVCVNTDAASHIHREPKVVLQTAERKKRALYQETCNKRRARLFPFAVSVDGCLGESATKLMQEACKVKSKNSGKPYGDVMRSLRTKMTFAIIKASAFCLRASRTKWNTSACLIEE
eukprot:GHVN01075071.1.p1 GENE.GHVN01075071.1~~GHVN01075071.1.p1  ORF type:complete len:406 (-),score=54.57 GHVN01075071.1:192-1409(-)